MFRASSDTRKEARWAMSSGWPRRPISDSSVARLKNSSPNSLLRPTDWRKGSEEAVKLRQQLGVLEGALWTAGSGVIDQHVQPPKEGHRLLDQLGGEAFLEKVPHDDQRLGVLRCVLTNLGGHLFQGGRVGAREDHLGAELGELNGNGRSDARRRAGDEGHFAPKVPSGVALKGVQVIVASALNPQRSDRTAAGQFVQLFAVGNGHHLVLGAVHHQHWTERLRDHQVAKAAVLFRAGEPGCGEEGRVEDEPGDGGELGGQVQRGRRAQALSVEDDLLRREVVAVVGENVDAQAVAQGEEVVGQVAQVDGAAVAEENGQLGRLRGLDHQTGNLVAAGGAGEEGLKAVGHSVTVHQVGVGRVEANLVVRVDVLCLKAHFNASSLKC
ncbi:hypothetical protein TYRP_008903 [Tyrophagus putrescentiae]|nr:hypothetical protein TYRP_008903 [Tyrophagus putrescentiae]